MLPKAIVVGTLTSSMEHQIKTEGKTILKQGKTKSSEFNFKFEDELIHGKPGPA